MNIETAIKQNKQWLKENPHLGEVRGFKALPPYDAIQLGIEALEIINQIRLLAGFGTNFWASSVLQLIEKLPSETE